MRFLALKRTFLNLSSSVSLFSSSAQFFMAGFSHASNKSKFGDAQERSSISWINFSIAFPTAKISSRRGHQVVVVVEEEEGFLLFFCFPIRTLNETLHKDNSF